MEYTTQNLEYAVSVFYNGEQVDRARAHAWLTEAQRVPAAWTFVWELLQPTKGTEIQFYAATTLHTKILRCWNEVPQESYEELKEKILQAVLTYSKGPKIVTNRLCISLAAFILQQGTADLASLLRPLSTADNTSLLLEVLTVIPEEYNSMTMGHALRLKNRTALQQACPAVLDDMTRYLNTVYNDYSKEGPSEPTILSWTLAANCACSWLTLGGEGSPETSCRPLPELMPLCRALATVVQVLYKWNDAVSDTALDACEACLSAIRAAGSSEDSARYPAAALELMTDLVALASPIMAKDDVPYSINEELLSAVITCCVAIAETHSLTLVAAVENEAETRARGLLELFVAAQATPGHYPLHETRSNLVFGLWYTLQDEVLNVADNSRKVNPVWREVFSRLLTALVTKSEAPSDQTMSRDDVELLRCYRQDIADTVMYCYCILGDWCWATVEAAFTAADSEQRREAALHIFLALSDSAPHEQAPDSLVNLLQNTINVVKTSTNERTLNTALDCLGGYANWLGSVPGPRGSALSRDCVQAAGEALQRSPAPAALALRKLCTECSAPAAGLATEIVHAAKNDSVALDPWVRRQLMGAAGASLAATDQATATPLLHDLATYLVQELRSQESEVNASGAPAENCSALICALAPQPHLAAMLLRTLLPALPPHAQRRPLVEPMFILLKQSVLTLTSDCMPFVNEIAQLIITGFDQRPCAPGLDLVDVLILMFASDWPEAGRLFHSCVGCAARTIAPNPPAAADVTEGLFLLLHSVTKKKPQCVDWIEDLLPELVELGGLCVRMWEKRAASACCRWLSALAHSRPAALAAHAPQLTAAVLRCIGGATPRNQIEPLAELLLALNRAPWPAGQGELASWLRLALAAPAFPTPHATDAHKHKFIAAVIKEKSSRRRLLETVQEFSLACRGLIGTEYARQTMASKQLVA